MSLKTDEGTRLMFREMLACGLHEALQAALTFLLGRTGDALCATRRARARAWAP